MIDRSGDEVTQIGEPKTLSFPSGWTLSTSWKRAVSDPIHAEPIDGRSWRIYMGGKPHRTAMFIHEGSVRVDCDCNGFCYNRSWCAHVAALWWLWSRCRIRVRDVDAGRSHPSPPPWIRLDDADAVLSDGGRPTHARARPPARDRPVEAPPGGCPTDTNPEPESAHGAAIDLVLRHRRTSYEPRGDRP